MAYINTGLSNSGLTQYFEVTYESTLSTAQGLEVARELMRFCDADYRLLVDWFRGATNMPGRLPVHVDNSTGGATWGSLGPIYNIYLGLGEQVLGVSPATFARYLLVSELSEIFMRNRQFLPNDWSSFFNEGNKGEALSCFLANEFLGLSGSLSMPGTPTSSFSKAHLWLNSSRANFLDRNDANAATGAEISCGLSFLNYLHHQRGVAIGDIIANGADTLEGVFENLGLGSRSAAFAAFRAAVDSHYVQDNRLVLNPVLDNAFPAPELTDLVATPQVSWVTTGLTPSGRIVLSRRVPMDVLLVLSTDRPDLLDLPADRIVRRGMDDDEFSFSVKPQSAAFANANANITVEYAGMKLQRLVQVYAPSAWPMPPLRIVAQAPTDPCADAFIAGSRQAFSIDNLSAFPSRRGLRIAWQVNHAAGTGKPDGTFVIEVLPAAGTTVSLTVVATNSDGVTARGHLDFMVHSPKSGLEHELAVFECRIRQIADMVNRFPRPPIPGYKAKREEVLTAIAIRAQEISVHTGTLAQDARSAILGKEQEAS